MHRFPPPFLYSKLAPRSLVYIYNDSINLLPVAFHYNFNCLKSTLRLEFLYTLLQIKLVFWRRDFELSFLWPTSSPRQHLLIIVGCWRQGQCCASLSDTSALEAESSVDGEGRCPRSLHLVCLGMELICKSQRKRDWGPSILSSASPIRGFWVEEGSPQLLPTPTWYLASTTGNGEIWEIPMSCLSQENSPLAGSWREKELYALGCSPLEWHFHLTELGEGRKYMGLGLNTTNSWSSYWGLADFREYMFLYLLYTSRTISRYFK